MPELNSIEIGYSFFKDCLMLSNSILSEAIIHAVKSSFNETADLVQVAIETDCDENQRAFTDAIDHILAEHWSFRLQIDVNNKDGQAVSDYNLWFIDSYKAFRRLFKWILGYHKDSQLYYFIVLKNSQVIDHLNGIQNIFSDFLLLMIANVNVIIETTSGEVLFYTFYPYQHLRCRSAKPLIINRFHNNLMEQGGQFFPSKADNLYGCSLRIRTRNNLILIMGGYELSDKLANYEMSLLELIMVKEFASRMNFTFEIYNATYRDPGFKKRNVSKLSGAHELMANGETDLILGFYKIDTLENQFLSKSVTYYLCWLVICLLPRPNTVGTRNWLFVPFNGTAWIYTAASFILILGCIILARKNKRFSRVFHLQYHPRGLEIIAVAIGAPVIHLPRQDSLRSFIIVLSLGGIILRGAYQGKLFDAYQGREMLNLPQSIRELFDKNYTVYTYMYYRSIINDLNGAEYLNIQNLESGLRGYNIYKMGGRTALVNSYIPIYTFYTSDQRRNLTLKPILREQICMFFQQHSVIQPKINEIITRMIEAGIVHQFGRNFEHLIDTSASSYNDGHEPVSLGLEELSLTFYLWGTFCGISCFIFAVELLYYRFK